MFLARSHFDLGIGINRDDVTLDGGRRLWTGGDFRLVRGSRAVGANTFRGHDTEVESGSLYKTFFGRPRYRVLRNVF